MNRTLRVEKMKDVSSRAPFNIYGSPTCGKTTLCLFLRGVGMNVLDTDDIQFLSMTKENFEQLTQEVDIVVTNLTNLGRPHLSFQLNEADTIQRFMLREGIRNPELTRKISGWHLNDLRRDGSLGTYKLSRSEYITTYLPDILSVLPSELKRKAVVFGSEVFANLQRSEGRSRELVHFSNFFFFLSKWNVDGLFRSWVNLRTRNIDSKLQMYAWLYKS